MPVLYMLTSNDRHQPALTSIYKTCNYFILVSWNQTMNVTTSMGSWALGQGIVKGKFQGRCCHVDGLNQTDQYITVVYAVMNKISLRITIPWQMKHFWTIFLFYKSPRHSSKTLNGSPATAPYYCTLECHILWIFQNISITLSNNFWVFFFLYSLLLI